MTNLDSVLKSEDITLPAKFHIVNGLYIFHIAMIFLVVVYEHESWTIRKAEELMILNCGVGEDS